MDAAQIFGLMNLLILPGWLLLLLAPRWQWTHRLVMTGIYSAVYALAYAVFLAVALPEARLDFGSLASVTSLLQQPWMLLAAWTHFLTFDLFVAAWMVKDSQAIGRRHLFMIPVLCLSFYLGPLGFGLYMLTKRLRPHSQVLHTHG